MRNVEAITEQLIEIILNALREKAERCLRNYPQVPNAFRSGKTPKSMVRLVYSWTHDHILQQAQIDNRPASRINNIDKLWQVGSSVTIHIEIQENQLNQKSLLSRRLFVDWYLFKLI